MQRDLIPNASFYGHYKNPGGIWTCKKSKTTELLYVLKHEQSWRGALKQEFAACRPLPSPSRHILLPDGGATQQEKKRLKANMTQLESSPGAGR